MIKKYIHTISLLILIWFQNSTPAGSNNSFQLSSMIPPTLSPNNTDLSLSTPRSTINTRPPSTNMQQEPFIIVSDTHFTEIQSSYKSPSEDSLLSIESLLDEPIPMIPVEYTHPKTNHLSTQQLAQLQQNFNTQQPIIQPLQTNPNEEIIEKLMKFEQIQNYLQKNTFVSVDEQEIIQNLQVAGLEEKEIWDQMIVAWITKHKDFLQSKWFSKQDWYRQTHNLNTIIIKNVLTNAYLIIDTVGKEMYKKNLRKFL